VVLVDDLPAELDSHKRQLLMQALQRSGAQVFLTATEASLFPAWDYPDSRMFHVEQGTITPAD
jgi:DNA replication and repair protein RecF